MAYDDESSLWDFRDLESLAAILERYLNAPENITVIRLLALTRATHELTGGQEAERVGLSELAAGLREKGLAGVPFDTVARVMEAVSKVDAEEDVLAHVSLRDLQRIVTR